jgi:hypothetical protein
MRNSLPRSDIFPVTLWAPPPDRWAVDGHSITVAGPCCENRLKTVVRQARFLLFENLMKMEQSGTTPWERALGVPTDTYPQEIVRLKTGEKCP